MLMQNFGGQTKCIMGDVDVANTQKPWEIRFEVRTKLIQKIHTCLCISRRKRSKRSKNPFVGNDKGN